MLHYGWHPCDVEAAHDAETHVVPDLTIEALHYSKRESTVGLAPKGGFSVQMVKVRE